MLLPLDKNFRGLITVCGPTKSGKSELAEFLIKEQELVTYIATSKPRRNDPEWNKRIKLHKERRSPRWNLIEYPSDISKAIQSIRKKESILIDSLGGLVEQHLSQSDAKWEIIEEKFIKSLIKSELGIIVVSEEIGWGVSPATQVGHMFRERLSNLSSLISRNSIKKWLAINGTAIDLDMIGHPIP